ncbi:Uncharacterised protein (plasmid) [Legionella adelaidensis]|uniref:Alpha/beta hydrolase n=1 Tax=Legionella adelaidensis TaxID=45056 RepID=A0A0W0R0K1_9GAMM|nr:hypothetical protein [Legionella adelaidensis]KTC64491.1 hypothetical protein Lade_1785 [Legionella adelaidensis]VEH85859.1 Uncharacterised protein [Legionella adelaidensis]
MKKIKIIAPVMPCPRDIEKIAASLSFLNTKYILDFVDPLSHSISIHSKNYYDCWNEYLQVEIDKYDAFLGFSFGGVILQQCFPQFVKIPKPLFLFSTPSFSNFALQEKLGKVITLCKENKAEEAIRQLTSDVAFFPEDIVEIKVENPDEACERLIYGLQKVLDTDSVPILEKYPVTYWHFIGDSSRLVNNANVIPPQSGELFEVPHAGMRVLQDNPDFCRQKILEKL